MMSCLKLNEEFWIATINIAFKEEDTPRYIFTDVNIMLETLSDLVLNGGIPPSEIVVFKFYTEHVPFTSHEPGHRGTRYEDWKEGLIIMFRNQLNPDAETALDNQLAPKDRMIQDPDTFQPEDLETPEG